MTLWPIILFIVAVLIIYAMIVIGGDWLDEFLDTLTDDKSDD